MVLTMMVPTNVERPFRDVESYQSMSRSRVGFPNASVHLERLVAMNECAHLNRIVPNIDQIQKKEVTTINASWS